MDWKLDKVFLIPTALVGFVLLAGSTSHAVNGPGRNYLAARGSNKFFAMAEAVPERSIAQRSGQNHTFQMVQAGSVKAVSDFLITNNSVGSVRLGMTVAQARRALGGLTLSRTSDGEGIALIAVKRGKQTIMTLYADEQNPRSRINERAKIEFIEVWDARYYTPDGVHPKMPLREVEQKYGQLKEIRLSEIEAREFATLATQPVGIQLRVTNDTGMAGIYNEGENTTTRYAPSTYLKSISITGRGNATPQFSSRYTDLKKQCKNLSPGRDEGQHTSLFCQGYGGFQLHIFDAATMVQINLETLDRQISLPLAHQSLTYDQQVSEIEWRLVDEKPFAVIMRVFKYSDKGDFPFQGKPIGESLIVKGLPGFEQVDYEVDATSNSNANAKAREMADSGYSQQTAQLNRGESETLEDFAKRIIPRGMQLGHHAVEGKLGPSQKSLVILFEADKAAAKSYKGWVLAPAGGGYEKYPLPEPEFTWSMEEPKAVFFANADKDPEQELFILGECYTGVGPTGAQPFNRTRVYDWNGNGFTHLEGISRKIGTAATVPAVRKKLAHALQRSRKPKRSQLS